MNEIDFDDASSQWKQNKKKLENGCYSYVCGYILKNGKPCQRKSILNQDICSYEYCFQHQKISKKIV